MVLMEKPKYLKVSTVIITEMGMAASEISVVRIFSKKKYSTTATTAAAASSLPRKVFTEDSMNVAWRIVTCGSPMPGGSPFFNWASASSILSVSLTVSAPGCF